MVHLRINEREANPNPLVNFTTALPWITEEGQEEARQLLRALAAQVRPVMKAHGFTVNSLEEYEHNPVFSGRNWNNGETVELVLRRSDGSFMPISWLLSTLCHEHMNHGLAFQALWKGLNAEVQALQRKGYYGDGYWSSGRRLADSAKISGEGLRADELPEYMCGGAQSHSRPSARRRRNTASTSADGKPAKKRKPGARVTSKKAFVGTGSVVAGDGAGTSFRKQAGSKRAREERAAAIERRLQLLKPEPKLSSPEPAESDTEDDSDVEIVAETDQDRRQTLNASENVENLKGLKSRALWDYFQNAFTFDTPPVAASGDEFTVCDVIVLSDDEDTSKETGKSRPVKVEAGPSKSSTNARTPTPVLSAQQPSSREPPRPNVGEQPPSVSTVSRPTGSDKWTCPVCTLVNEPLHLVCAACETIRGEVALSA